MILCLIRWERATTRLLTRKRTAMPYERTRLAADALSVGRPPR
ncbi:hypothetical protein [Streptomyces thermolilacinus]|nr:hypothetical protein [Streptomyces thermolilacinus]